MFDELRVLTDLPFLEELLRTRGMDALKARLEEALARLPGDARVTLEEGLTVEPRTLRILRDAIALDEDFLREHPEALFQCLYNRLRWFDAPDAAPYFEPLENGPWSRPDAHLHTLARAWRRQRDARAPAPWLESLRPLKGKLDVSGKLLEALEGDVHCLALSPSADRLATGSWGDEGNLCLWDVTTGERTHVLEGHPEIEILSVAWSADGRRLVSGSRLHDVRVWDAETGERLADFQGQEGRVTSVAFSPDGRHVAAGNLGWVARLFDVASGEAVRVFEGHQQSVLSVSFHPSGRWLATGSSDNSARVWDVETGAQVAHLPARSSVQSVAFSPDGAWLAMSGSEGVFLVETAGWTQVRQLEGVQGGDQLQWLGLERLGVVPFDRVAILDVRSGKSAVSRELDPEGIEHFVAFHPDGRRIFRSEAGGRVRLIDLTNMSGPPPSLKQEQSQLSSLWSSPGATSAVVANYADSYLMDSEGHLHLLPREPQRNSSALAAMNGDGTLLAYPSTQYQDDRVSICVALIDTRTRALLRILGEGDDALWATWGDIPQEPLLDVSPDGARVAVTMTQDTAQVWNARTGARLHALRVPGPGGTLSFQSFTPDGACLVLASAEAQRLGVYELESGALVLDLPAPPPGESFAHATAARASLLAVGQEAGGVELFDWKAASRRRLQVTSGEVVKVALSADGALLAVGDSEGTLRLLETGSGVAVQKWELSAPAGGLALDNGVLVAPTQDGRTHVFDLATGAPRADIPGQADEQEVPSMEFWGAFSDGPYAVYRRHEFTPCAHFPDGLESTRFLPGGLLVGMGQQDFGAFYLLKIHHPSIPL